MMKLDYYINKYRKEQKMSLEDLSQKSGVPIGTLSKISAGITKNPSLDTVQAIARALDRTLDDFDDLRPQRTYSVGENALVEMYRELDDHGKRVVDSTLALEYERVNKIVEAEQPAPAYTFAKASSRRNVPILGYTAAGAPIEAIEQEIDMPEGEDIPDRATLGLVVRGDSMEPVITDGSIVWVDGTAIPHSGDIGVFLIDGEATCKKLVRVNGRYVLRSLNSAYDDIVPADWQDVRPVGKVVVPRKDYVFRAARDGSLGPITDPEGVYNNRVEGAAINKRVAQLKKEGKLKPHDEF